MALQLDLADVLTGTVANAQARNANNPAASTAPRAVRRKIQRSRTGRVDPESRVTYQHRYSHRGQA